MKIKPPFNNTNYKLCNWLISNYPEDYEEMAYLEPFGNSAATLINKSPSAEETINCIDADVLRTIRDQPKEFIANFKKSRGKKENIIKNIKAMSERLKHVYILNKPVQEVIKAFDNKNTFSYVEVPPFGEIDMDIMELVKSLRGKVIVFSVYSTCYNRFFKGWRKICKNNDALWANY